MKYQEESTKVSIVSVSRFAAAPQRGHSVATQSSAAASGLRPLRRVVVDLGQLDRQLVVGHGDDAALLAVDDRDRGAPVALARDEPVAQAVVDRRFATAVRVQPGDDLLVGLAVVLAVEASRCRHRPVAGIRQSLLVAGDLGIGTLDHPLDRQVECLGELVVASVVTRDRHDRAGAVLHQHVVGDEHRNRLAVDGVDDAAAKRHARLGAALVAAILDRLAGDLVDVLAHRRLGRRTGDQALELGVLGGEDEEGRAEERVGPGGEDGEVELELLTAEDHLRPLRAADPVALHGDHVLGPGLEQLEVVEQPLGVLGDLEEPLLESPLLHLRATALAASVDDLLVGEHGGVHRAPLNWSLLAVGEAVLEEAQEDPLGPAVVLGRVGAELTRPIDRDPPLAKLAAKGLDRALGRLARRLAGLDRVVLRGQAEGVVAHRVDHLEAVAATEVGDRVADRVALEVTDVGLARGVGEHLEHVGLRLGLVETGLPGVRDLPGLLLGPEPLPLRLDRLWVVTGHWPRSYGGAGCARARAGFFAVELGALAERAVRKTGRRAHTGTPHSSSPWHS